MAVDDSRLEELEELFHQLDRNGDGRIDKAEFQQLVDALDMGLTPEQLDIGYGEVDTDGSGAISLEELVEWCAERW